MNTSQPPSTTASASPNAGTVSGAQDFGAIPGSDAYGPQALFEPLSSAQIAAGSIAPLIDFSLLAVTGEDAASFLHNQLTNDVEHLDAQGARWYGYCSPKGRLMATFLGWREASDCISLLIAQPQCESIRKRLSMFVLRAKAKVQEASASRTLFGLTGIQAVVALRTLDIDAPAPMQHLSSHDFRCIGLPAARVDDQDCPRWLLSVPRERAVEVWNALTAQLAKSSSSDWRWTEVLTGIPRIVPATSEQFVPQMLNFELVDGVNFKKGCYPGQEIVARTQYRGTLKRRMFLGHLQGTLPEPGSDVQAQGAGEPCGKVVLAARSPDGGVDCLFEAQISAVQEHALSIDQAPVELRQLPYLVPL
jgi:folate-binding protein YgfZ